MARSNKSFQISSELVIGSLVALGGAAAVVAIPTFGAPEPTINVGVEANSSSVEFSSDRSISYGGHTATPEQIDQCKANPSRCREKAQEMGVPDFVINQVIGGERF